jgi:multidrug transporter EmrE-like cation transporter
VKNIFLILASAVFTAAGQLCMRKGMMQIGSISFAPSMLERLPAMLGNIFLWLGLFAYASSLFFWLITLSRVGVGFAYLIQCSGCFVIITVISHFILGEDMPLMRIAGLLIICLGLFIVARTG